MKAVFRPSAPIPASVLALLGLNRNALWLRRSLFNCCSFAMSSGNSVRVKRSMAKRLRAGNACRNAAGCNGPPPPRRVREETCLNGVGRVGKAPLIGLESVNS